MKQPNDKTTRTRPGSQRGLSLIELMISITIGLLILVSLSSMFLNQSKARAELDKSNRMIDNGRYALELLSSNLRMAGFYDSYVPSGVPTVFTATLPDPCDLSIITDAAQNIDILRLHVQGVDATPTTTPAFSTECAAVATASASAVTLKPGSDILVIRRASTASVLVPTAAVSGTTYLQVSNCPTDDDEYVINTAPAIYSATTFPLYQKGCVTVATRAVLRPFLVQAYFVSPNNNSDDGIPTLKRMEFDPSGATSDFKITPLVEGIEYMQIDYGLDSVGNDGVADSYVDCSACSPADWSNVVSVKINLLARNVEPSAGHSDNKTYSLGLVGAATATVGPFNAAPYNTSPNPTTYPKLENYKRHAYTQLVRLVNPSGRREDP